MKKIIFQKVRPSLSFNVIGYNPTNVCLNMYRVVRIIGNVRLRRMFRYEYCIKTHEHGSFYR